MQVREENPLAYFKGLLSLLPKDESVETQTEQTCSDSESLSATVAFIERLRQASKAEEAALDKKSPEPMA